MRSPYASILLFIATFIPATSYSAAIWDGGGINSQWATKENWDDDVVPGNTADVSIGTAFTSGTSISLSGISRTVNSLAFTGSTGISIAPGSGTPAITLTSGQISKASTASVTIDTGIILGAAGLFNVSAGSSSSGALRINGVITDGANTFGVVKTGTSDLMLGGNNDFGGGFELGAGSLWIGNTNALGSGTFKISSSASDVWFNAATLTVGNAIQFSSAGSVNFRGASGVNPFYTIDGSLSGSFSGSSSSFSIRGNAATWTFNSSITLTGLGAAGLNLNSEAPGSSTYIFAVNPSISGSINGRILLGTTLTNGTGGSGNLLVKNAITFGGSLIDVNNGGGVDTIGGTHASGTVNIAPSNSIRLYDVYAGATNFVSLNANAITNFSTLINDDTSSVQVQVNATWSQYTATSGNATVVQSPTGIVQFSRAAGNTYDGGTVVNAGTLLVTNTSGSATGTGAVEIKTGATLGGSGIITGTVTGRTGSTFAPGDLGLIGTLRLSGGLTLASGGNFTFQLNGASTDQINFGAGDVSLNGTLTFNFSALGPVVTGTPYTLFMGSGAWSGAPSFAFNAPAGYQLDLTYGSGGYFWNASGKSLTVQFAAIPEPSTAGLLVGTLVVAGLLRQRNRKLA